MQKLKCRMESLYYRYKLFFLSCLQMKKTLFTAIVICCILTSLFTFAHIAHAAPKNVFSEDLEKVVSFSFIAAEATRIIGLRVTVIFMILGMILLNFSAGLRHPGYGRWGRSSLITSVLSFLIILIVPPLLYQLF